MTTSTPTYTWRCHKEVCDRTHRPCVSSVLVTLMMSRDMPCRALPTRFKASFVSYTCIEVAKPSFPPGDLRQGGLYIMNDNGGLLLDLLQPALARGILGGSRDPVCWNQEQPFFTCHPFRAQQRLSQWRLGMCRYHKLLASIVIRLSFLRVKQTGKHQDLSPPSAFCFVACSHDNGDRCNTLRSRRSKRAKVSLIFFWHVCECIQAAREQSFLHAHTARRRITKYLANQS